VLILLPPSEGKSAPLSGHVLALESLSFPELDATRRKVLGVLTHLCAGDANVAARALGLGPTQLADVARDAQLALAPCRPAISVYSGVLFDALGYPTMSERARSRARSRIAIASGLWGLIRPMDRIPYYRLSSSAVLPGLGTLASEWKPSMTSALGGTRGLVVDLRSGGYAALGPMPEPAVDRVATVRVLQERDGRRSVVSHFNKATKGRVVRALLESRGEPRTPAELVIALRDLGFRVEPWAASRKGHPIDIIVEET
jgi:cytoplasmic iron level regulating protein YaaA (DUF328/UPF0246 family)